MRGIKEMELAAFFMRKVRTSLICISFLAMSPVNSYAATVDRVLAIINNEIVTVSDYKKFMMQSGTPSSSDSVDEKFLKKLIDNKIILAEAKKSGIDGQTSEVSQYIKEFQKNNNISEEEFRKRLAVDGMTLKDYENYVRDDLIVLKFIDKELDSKIIVTDKEINDYYTNNLKLFIDKPERMTVRAIFIKISASPTLTEITDLKMKSLKIKTEINKGEPFEKMVDAYAEESFKSHEGSLGEIERGALIPELDAAVSSLKEGEISEPIWTKKGVYIIKMAKKLRAEFTPLIQVRDNIYALLYQKKKEEKYNSWMKLLWEKSSVIIKQ